MYRITKVLNHNTVLAVKDKSAREYLIVGKGVGLERKLHSLSSQRKRIHCMS